MACSFLLPARGTISEPGGARSCYAGGLSSSYPFRSAAVMRISSRMLAARGVRRGGPLGTTTWRPQPSPRTASARRPDGGTGDGEGGDFRAAGACSGLTHGSGPPTDPRQHAEGASPIPPHGLPPAPTRATALRKPPGGGRWGRQRETPPSLPGRGGTRSRGSQPTGLVKRAPPSTLLPLGRRRGEAARPEARSTPTATPSMLDWRLRAQTT